MDEGVKLSTENKVEAVIALSNRNTVLQGSGQEIQKQNTASQEDTMTQEEIMEIISNTSMAGTIIGKNERDNSETELEISQDTLTSNIIGTGIMGVGVGSTINISEKMKELNELVEVLKQLEYSDSEIKKIINKISITRKNFFKQIGEQLYNSNWYTNKKEGDKGYRYKKGDKDKGIKAINMMLKELGYDIKDKNSEEYKKDTTEAVLHFRKLTRMEEDPEDIVGMTTIKDMIETLLQKHYEWGRPLLNDTVLMHCKEMKDLELLCRVLYAENGAQHNEYEGFIALAIIISNRMNDKYYQTQTNMFIELTKDELDKMSTLKRVLLGKSQFDCLRFTHAANPSRNTLRWKRCVEIAQDFDNIRKDFIKFINKKKINKEITEKLEVLLNKKYLFFYAYDYKKTNDVQYSLDMNKKMEIPIL